MGEHNSYDFEGLLGLPPEEMQNLVAANVLY
jgi:hypothetical protein